MTDPVSAARTARENLAKGLGALQSPGVPPQVSEVAEPIAQAMSSLHQIESSQGAALSAQAPSALDAVRRALSMLQQAGGGHPAINQATESVAGSLSLVHQLAQAGGAAPPPGAPAGAPPAAVPRPAPAAAPAPAPAPAPAAAPAPAPAGFPPAAPPGAAPAAVGAVALGGTHVMQPQAAQPQPGMPQSAAPMTQPSAGPGPAAGQAPPQVAMQQPAPAQQPPQAPPAQQPPQQAQQAPPMQQAPPQAAPQAGPSPQSASGPPVQAPQGHEHFDAELGAHSATNFYKGLAGNDVVNDGGLFIATYQIPDVGTQLHIKVTMPGGYEFEALGVVSWTRDMPHSGADSPPGFGAKFTQISPEGRQLVYRYVRNREPLFHDDL